MFVGQQQHSVRTVVSGAAAVEVPLSLRKVQLCTSILVLTPTSTLVSEEPVTAQLMLQSHGAEREVKIPLWSEGKD